MTEEQRIKFFDLSFKYRGAKSGYAGAPYEELLEYVETLIDEAVKDAINAYKAEKE